MNELEVAHELLITSIIDAAVILIVVVPYVAPVISRTRGGGSS